MNAIIGMSDLMKTDNLDSIQINYFSDIKKSAKALLQIINDILDFSKIEAGKLEIIPIHFSLLTFYDNLCSMCQFSAGAKGLEFIHSYAPDVPNVIYGDEVRYRQIITNLLHNAVKYTRHGCIDFKISVEHRNGTEHLRFSVIDTGIGIKKTDIPHLFDSFQQIDGKVNYAILGTGLGLAITKMLVDIMEGEIEVESEYGEGSMFTIYLPFTKGDPAKMNLQESFFPIKVRDASILVVDDNAINLAVAKGFMVLHNIEADTAESGPAAIEMIRSKHYDIVFMDHMMPDMDGIEATAIIREMDGGKYKGIPVIALTANAVVGAREMFAEAGMDDFISKPIDEARINQILTRWLPEEKIDLMHVAIHKTENDEDFTSHIFSELAHIVELDVQLGLFHVGGSKAVYISVLRQFCNEMAGYLNNIKKYMWDSDEKNYKIIMHAVKGMLSNIGNETLSEWAYKLEMSSGQLNGNEIINDTVAFCEEASQLCLKLLDTGLLKENTPQNKQTGSEEELNPRLDELIEACLTGDSERVDEINIWLSLRTFGEMTDLTITDICGLLDNFDYEQAVALIKKLRENQ
jgi:CheY-like chemotaxis protein/HPt (histidine-containing phosphotransfer) domain-containing protein/anti-sigma regulatory factor (Ser/Thr protein kinase)